MSRRRISTDWLRLIASGLRAIIPVDGNKRAAFLAAGLFLAMNGCVLDVDADAEERVVLAVVSGEMDEEELARWLEGHRHSGS